MSLASRTSVCTADCMLMDAAAIFRLFVPFRMLPVVAGEFLFYEAHVSTSWCHRPKPNFWSILLKDSSLHSNARVCGFPPQLGRCSSKPYCWRQFILTFEGFYRKKKISCFTHNISHKQQIWCRTVEASGMFESRRDKKSLLKLKTTSGEPNASGSFFTLTNWSLLSCPNYTVFYRL